MNVHEFLLTLALVWCGYALASACVALWDCYDNHQAKKDRNHAEK